MIDVRHYFFRNTYDCRGNNYIVVIDENDKRLFEKRLPNTLEAIAPALEQFKKTGAIQKSDAD